MSEPSADPLRQKQRCQAKYRLPVGRNGAFGCHTFFCQLKADHEGEHKDFAGCWHSEWEKQAEPSWEGA